MSMIIGLTLNSQTLDRNLLRETTSCKCLDTGVSPDKNKAKTGAEQTQHMLHIARIGCCSPCYEGDDRKVMTLLGKASEAYEN